MAEVGAALILASGGLGLLLLGRSVLINAGEALLGACGALIGFAGLVCLIMSPFVLFS